MKKLLALLMVVLLVCAACGEPRGQLAKVSDEPTLDCSEEMYVGYPQAEEIWVPCVAEVDGYRFELSKMQNSDGTFTYEYVNLNFGSGERDTDVAKARALLKAVVGLEDVNLDLYTDESLLNSLNAERTRGTMKEFRYEVE